MAGRQADWRDQLLLPLDPPVAAGGFITGEANAAAAAVARGRARWTTRLGCVAGPPRSGKTLLLRESAPATEPLGPDDLRAGLSGAERIETALASGALLAVDDVDQRLALGDPDLELGFFHLINRLGPSGGALLLSARTPPSAWRVALPDLRTRLATAIVARISEPDDALAIQLIERHFAALGRAVGPARSGGSVDADAAARILNRFERTYAAIEAAVRRLDEAALRARRRIDARFAAAVLAEAGEGAAVKFR